MTYKVSKTDGEWKKQLSQEEYSDCRQKGTEAPFTDIYCNSKEKGTYNCLCCNEKLFSSDKKFDSGNAVAVAGVVEIFLEKSQLIIKKINKATIQHYSRYGFDPAKVVPSSKKNPDKMWSEIETLINGIKNIHKLNFRI